MTKARDTANLTGSGVGLSLLDIDAGTDIGAALVDADLMIVDDGAGGTNRKATMSRLATYMGTKITGGSLVYLASSGAISSGTASVSFTQFDATKYDHYQFHMQHIMPATDGASLFAHASTDGGSNYDTTSGNYHTNQVDRTGFHITDGLENTGGGESGVSGVFYLYAPHVTNKYTYGLSESVHMVSVDYVSFLNAQTAHLAAQDTDALQFKFDSGNIASGEIVMYGIANGT